MPIRQNVVPRSLRLSRLAMIRAAISWGTLDRMKMPKVLKSAFQKSASPNSLVKLAKPAQPFWPGSSSRQVRSDTIALKTIGNRPKIANSTKNGATKTYGMVLVSKRWSQSLPRPGLRGGAACCGAVLVCVRDIRKRRLSAPA